MSDFNKLAIYTPDGEITIYKVGQHYSNGTIEGFEIIKDEGYPVINLIASKDNKQYVHMSVTGLPYALLNEEWNKYISI